MGRGTGVGRGPGWGGGPGVRKRVVPDGNGMGYGDDVANALGSTLLSSAPILLRCRSEAS